MSPTNEINTGSLNLIFSKIFIKTNLPINANPKDIDIFSKVLAAVNHINDTSTPKRAASIVPAVVGDTNLFLLSCCMIRPAILILAPAIKILTSLGNRLTSKTSACSSVNLKISNSVTSDTPIKIDINDNINNGIINKRSFIYILSLSIYHHSNLSIVLNKNEIHYQLGCRIKYSTNKKVAQYIITIFRMS